MRKLAATVLCCLLLMSILPEAAKADGEGTLSISCSPAGAEVYIDGVLYEPAAAPCDILLAPGDYNVQLRIPGYVTYTNSVTIESGKTATLSGITLLPEITASMGNIMVGEAGDPFVPESITISDISVMPRVSLRQAVYAVMNDTSSTHYNIEIDPSITSITLDSQININRRGNLTINGDTNRDGTPDVAISNSAPGSDINLLASDVHIIGFNFTGTNAQDGTLSIRPPDKSTDAISLSEIYVLGCCFKDSFEVGLAPCGAYGYAGTAQNGPGTFNVDGIYFCGNTFDKVGLFSFAGAGDEDFNHINNYNVYANQFTNCGAGVISGDAHTWYVYGKDDPMGNGGAAQTTLNEHNHCGWNVFENVTMSGNSFAFDGNAAHEFDSAIGVSVANMGNHDNIMQHVTIKNNKSTLTNPADKNLYSSVMISNSAIDDPGKTGAYSAPAADMENTHDNTLQDIKFVYNDIQTGDGRALQLYNIYSGTGYQNGSDNTTENITVAHNKIRSAQGVTVTDYWGECELGTAQRNDMMYITVEDNDIVTGNTSNFFDINDSGISVSGADLHDYNNYRGASYIEHPGGKLSNVTVKGNSISNFNCGVLAAGSRGSYTDGAGVEALEITNNTITCKPSMLYGIEIFGAGVGNWETKDDLNQRKNGSTSCYVKNVTVTGNNVTARGGISIMGGKYDGYAAHSISGNYVDTVTVSGNTFAKLGNSETDKQFNMMPVVIAGFSENWDNLKVLSPTMLNLSVSGVTLDSNTYSGFTNGALDLSPDKLPGGSMTKPAALAALASITDAAAGAGSYEWKWVSTPETNDTADKYIAAAYCRKGTYPNLLYPGMLYAQMTGSFTDVICSINYELNGGALPAGAKTSYSQGEEYYLPTPSKTGCDFHGWYENSGLSGPSVAKITASDTGNKTYYAKWQPRSYTVQFDANGGAGSMAPLGMRYGEEKNLPVNAFSREGCRFTGWAASAGGSVVYSDGAKVSNLTDTANGTVTLYAVWANIPPVGVTCSKTDATRYGAADGTITAAASGGESGSYSYTINEGASWQSSGYFTGVAADSYTVIACDAGNTGNRAAASVTVGQPGLAGSYAASKVPTKVNAGTAIIISPSAPPKNYSLKTVTYSSSNPAVAAVDANGNVTFMGGGKATISITTVSQTVDKKGKVITKTTVVRKSITVNQPVAVITLNTASATIAKKSTVRLSASVAPVSATNKKLKWTSSNTKVATVNSSGVVTGKSAGSVVITCTAQDGSRVSASCTVTVTPVYPSGIKVSKAALQIKAGKTAALKATVAPGNTDFKNVIWASSNPGVASVDGNGRVKGLAAGTAVITAATSNGLVAYCTVTVS